MLITDLLLIKLFKSQIIIASPSQSHKNCLSKQLRSESLILFYNIKVILYIINQFLLSISKVYTSLKENLHQFRLLKVSLNNSKALSFSF